MNFISIAAIFSSWLWMNPVFADNCDAFKKAILVASKTDTASVKAGV